MGVKLISDLADFLKCPTISVSCFFFAGNQSCFNIKLKGGDGVTIVYYSLGVAVTSPHAKKEKKETG